jgi:hypothetical protein
MGAIPPPWALIVCGLGDAAAASAIDVPHRVAGLEEEEEEKKKKKRKW